MNVDEKGVEIKVGLFVLAGLVLIAWMTLSFSRFGEGLRSNYSITVEFENASGLLKDSNVLLNGAKVGWVSSEPIITNDPVALEKATGVEVTLQIYSNINIPTGSRFQVGSSGLMGDRFVNVLPPAEISGESIEPGSVLAGSREAGLDDLTREGTDLMVDLRNTVSNINEVVVRLDQEILSEGNVEDVDVMLASFRDSSENVKETTSALAESGERIDEILDNANRTVLRADEAMLSAKLAGEDVRVAMQNARDALATVNTLVEQTSAGKGIIGRLIADEELGANLEALIYNLKEHGVIFYRDSALDEEDETGAFQPPAPRTGNPTRR